ncbi:hypothetical protein J0670_37485, partial [Streptomyces sp. FH025]|nr:hypothetical protein [Streptomyces sp. FH025]
MSELALYPVALFFALSAVHFARSRSRPRAAARYTCCATALLGTSLLVLAPPTVRAVQDAGLPGLPVLVLVIVLGDGLRDGAGAAIGLLALALRAAGPVPEGAGPDPRRVRARLALLGAVWGARLALVALAAPGLDGRGLTVSPDLSARLALAGYSAVGVLHLALCLAALLREVAGRARVAGPGPRGAGLRLLTGALAAGLLWNAWGVDDVVRAVARGAQDGPEDLLG